MTDKTEKTTAPASAPLSLTTSGEIPPQTVTKAPAVTGVRLRSLDEVYQAGRAADTIVELEAARELARHGLGVAQRANAREAQGLQTLVDQLDYKLDVIRQYNVDRFSACPGNRFQ